MKTVVLKNKKGKILNNDDIVYIGNDDEKKFPIRRIVRYSLKDTNRIMDIDCAGMGRQGDWGIDTFWDYYNDFYPELVKEVSSDSDFEDLIIDLFCL